MITRVAFVAHPVRDMGAARRFYGEVLGLAPGVDYQGVWSEFTTPDGHTVALDTFSPKYSETPSPYLALETDDIEAEVARLRAAGARIEMEPWLSTGTTRGGTCAAWRSSWTRTATPSCSTRPRRSGWARAARCTSNNRRERRARRPDSAR